MTTQPKQQLEAPWEGYFSMKNDLSGMTSREVMHEAGLDWDVRLKPIQVADDQTAIFDNVAVQRSDTGRVLGIVGNRYHPVQNVEAFEFFDSIVREGQVKYENVGILRDGKRVWMQASLGEVEIGQQADPLKKYVLLTNSHDGSSLLQVFFTPVRVWCQNTLNLAIRDGGKVGIAIRHTRSAVDQLDEARDVMQRAQEYYDVFAGVANNLAQKRYTAGQLKDLVQSLFPARDDGKVTKQADEHRAKVISLFDGGAGHEAIAGSAWAAVNAVAQWTDHEMDVRTKTHKNDKRLESIWTGRGQDMKQRAFGIVASQVGLAA